MVSTGSYTDNVTSGHTYKVTVDVTASKACSIGIKKIFQIKRIHRYIQIYRQMVQEL